MSRYSLTVVVVLIIGGSVVALLPAQESARRPGSKFRPAASIVPDAQTPVATPSTAPTADSATSPASDQLAPPPTNYLPIPAQPAAEDANQLRSVLKRSISEAVGQPAPLAASSPSAPSEAPQEFAPQPPLSQPAPAPLRQSRPLGASSRGLPAPISSVPRPGGAKPVVAPRSEGRTVQNLSVTAKSAALRIEVAGPDSVTSGRPDPYVVNLINDSDVAADEVLVRVSLPEWVAVRGAQATKGEAVASPDGQSAGRLLWSIPRVAGGGHEQLRLQLATSEGDSFDLGVDWTCKASSAKASIAVRQPKLELSLAGPADMTFGEEKIFTLSVSNPGTGDAERVIVAVSSGSAPPQQIEVGPVPAGHKKEVPIQVVASQAGELELKARATGEGKLVAETSGKVIVRKAEVSIAIEGPPLKFAGSEAVYLIAVANTGNAAADEVNLSLGLPPGATYLGGIEGAVASSPQSGNLKWKIATLAPGAERTYELRVQLTTAGQSRFVVQAQAGAASAATAEAETAVEAISDLRLVVNDPAGPLSTTEDAIYELQVMNRGSQAAERVKILVQFSGGIEPISFEGCEARLVPGQVVCQPLSELGAGQQVTLRVKAKANQAGNHQFRVEVTSADGDARLVSEGTTRFFSESGRAGAAATTASRPTLLPTQSIPGTLQR